MIRQMVTANIHVQFQKAYSEHCPSPNSNNMLYKSLLTLTAVS